MSANLSLEPAGEERAGAISLPRQESDFSTVDFSEDVHFYRADDAWHIFNGASSFLAIPGPIVTLILRALSRIPSPSAASD